MAVQGHPDQLANANDLCVLIIVITHTLTLVSKCYHLALVHLNGSISHCHSLSAENSHYRAAKECHFFIFNIFLKAFIKRVFYAISYRI